MVAPKGTRPEEKEHLDIHSAMDLDMSCTLFNFPLSFTPYKALRLNSLVFPLNSFTSVSGCLCIGFKRYAMSE